MFCSNCGEKLDNDAKFCTKCGAKSEQSPGGAQAVYQQTVKPEAAANQAPPVQSGGNPLRVLGIVLTVAGGIAGIATYAVDLLPVSVFAIAAVIVGLIIIQRTKKLPLAPGEVVLYEGMAAIGEGSAVMSRSKAQCKVLITSLGIKAGSFYRRNDLLHIPFETIAKVEKESALSARVHTAEGQSVKFQFAIGKLDRFLGILAHNNVPVTVKGE
jgi:hypothetical protein